MEKELTFEELYEAYNLLAKTNSQIGTLNQYNCRKLILNYARTIHAKTQKLIFFDDRELKFKRIVN